MNVKRLTPNKRIALVESAKKKGVSVAAREQGVNHKTVYYWLGRSQDGDGYERSNSPSVSDEERKTIISLAKRNGVSNMKMFMEKYSIKFCLSTIYKILASEKIPARIPKSLSYHCSVCEKTYKAILIYIGVTRNPPCPECGESLKYERGEKIYFLGSLDSYLLAHNGSLEKLAKDDVKFIRDCLRAPLAYFPKYVDGLDHNGDEATHIVAESFDKGLTYLCGSFSENEKSIVYSAFSGIVNCENLCGKCVDKANKRLSRGRELQPGYWVGNTKIAARRKRILDAIVLDREIGNVSLACSTHNISRNTLYKYRKSPMLLFS